MEHLDHAAFARRPPVPSYAMACTGAAPEPRCTLRAPLLGGLVTGLGVSGAYHLGAAALQLQGQGCYAAALVALSVVIAGLAATAALWAEADGRPPLAVTAASLITGAAVNGMHHTGMRAVSVRVTPSDRPLPGARAVQFVFPLGLGSCLSLTSAFAALSPTTGEREASASCRWPVESTAH
ncbi:MHYT domain-containing protein [Streptomyces sp. NPDC101225]|uniref:MHYT domain-containing protein n=1 Tax=Streptomyces sp. NPDC101225 TaxID=3366135 RepID=UPI0038262A5E